MKEKNSKKIFPIILIFIFFTFFRAFNENTDSGSGLISLTIKIELNESIYDYSDYGEPPQIAVWIEDTADGKIKTIYVTRRTAENDWHGKTECPVSLPIWRSREKRTTLPDGVSMATEKNSIIRTIEVRAEKNFNIFAEVNTAGDYNMAFPANFDDGSPDHQGNGQPSLIYRGKIKTKKGEKSTPVIIGRSMQLYPVKKMSKDLKGIISASQVISKIEISVK